MINYLIIQEDSVIVAQESKKPDKAFKVKFEDIVTGQAKTLHLTRVEFGCILALSTGMAEDDAEFSYLYYFCQEAIDRLPPLVRPVL